MNRELPGQFGFESIGLDSDIQSLENRLQNGERIVRLQPDSGLLANPEIAHRIAAEYASGALIFQGSFNLQNGYIEQEITEARLHLHDEDDPIDLFVHLHQLADMAHLSSMNLSRTSVSINQEVHYLQLANDKIFRCRHHLNDEPVHCRLPFPSF